MNPVKTERESFLPLWTDFAISAAYRYLVAVVGWA